MFKHQKLVYFHMLLASFFTPAILLFLITGSLYTFDVKGKVSKQKFELKLEKPFEPNLAILTQTVSSFLQNKHLIIPDGNPILKKLKKGYKFYWSGLKYVVYFKAENANSIVHVSYKERSFLTQLMRIHRADAGIIFKTVSLLSVLGLVLVLVSGLYMAYTSKRKKAAFVAFFLGFALLAILISFS